MSKITHISSVDCLLIYVSIPGLELRKLSCADAQPFSLLEESNLTGAKVSKALPYLEAKAKGDKSME
jgi:hypothetical protein